MPLTPNFPRPPAAGGGRSRSKRQCLNDTAAPDLRPSPSSSPVRWRVGLAPGTAHQPHPPASVKRHSSTHGHILAAAQAEAQATERCSCAPPALHIETRGQQRQPVPMSSATWSVLGKLMQKASSHRGRVQRQKAELLSASRNTPALTRARARAMCMAKLPRVLQAERSMRASSRHAPAQLVSPCSLKPVMRVLPQADGAGQTAIPRA